jgi:hypothetical protein
VTCSHEPPAAHIPTLVCQLRGDVPRHPGVRPPARSQPRVDNQQPAEHRRDIAATACAPRRPTSRRPQRPQRAPRASASCTDRLLGGRGTADGATRSDPSQRNPPHQPQQPQPPASARAPRARPARPAGTGCLRSSLAAQRRSGPRCCPACSVPLPSGLALAVGARHGRRVHPHRANGGAHVVDARGAAGSGGRCDHHRRLQRALLTDRRHRDFSGRFVPQHRYRAARPISCDRTRGGRDGAAILWYGRLLAGLAEGDGMVDLKSPPHRGPNDRGSLVAPPRRRRAVA